MSSFNTTTTYSRIHVSRIMSSIQHQQRLLAEASLGLFSATYEEILKSKGLKHGPVSGKELLEMMNEAIFGDGDVLAPEKPNDTSASEQAPEQASTKELQPESYVCEDQVVEQVTKKIEKKSEKALLSAKDVKKLLKTFKVLNDDGLEVKMELPFMPNSIDYTTGCQCLSINGGLLSPCMTRTKDGEKYCISCKKPTAATPGMFIIHGDVSFRKDFYDKGLEYSTPTGYNAETNTLLTSPVKDSKQESKQAISFGTYCAKRNVSRETVEAWLREHAPSLEVDELDWFVDKKKANRKIKISKKSETDTESDAEAPKKARGRPKKEKVANADPEAPKKARGRPKKVEKSPETSSDEEADVSAPSVAQEPVAVAPPEEPVAPEAPLYYVKKELDLHTDIIQFNRTFGEEEWNSNFIGHIRKTNPETKVHKFYAYDEDGQLYEISGSKAPLVEDADDFMLCGTFDEETEKMEIDEEEG